MCAGTSLAPMYNRRGTSLAPMYNRRGTSLAPMYIGVVLSTDARYQIISNNILRPLILASEDPQLLTLDVFIFR